MLTKTKKIALLTTGLAGTLLATTIGGIVLSSCTTTGSTVDDPKNEFGNTSTLSINWKNLEELTRLNIDKNGLVYSDQNRTTLIGVVPGTSVSELVIPSSVKYINGYTDTTNYSDQNSSAPQTPGTFKGAFEGQNSLTSIKFQGSSVQSIGKQAFKGCTSLTTIQLPSSVTEIGDSAFANTGAIAKINLNNVRIIGNSAFNSAFVNLPSSTTEIDLTNAQIIGTMAFMGNPALKSVNLNNNKLLRSIGDQAFENSNLVGTINLSNNTMLKSIGDSAFKGTTGLESVVLPSSLTNLGSKTGNEADKGAFQNSSIKSVDLSKTKITNLKQSTFNGAANLTTVSFPQSLTSIDVSAFTNTAIAKLDLTNTKIESLQNDSFQGVANLTEIAFPTTLTTLGTNALRGTGLASVDLSNTQLTTISQSVFEGNTALTSVKLPASLTTIQQSAFKDTTSLTSIDLSNTQVNNIGNNAFQNSGITSINLPKLTNETQFTTLGTGAFQGSKITKADFRNANLNTISPSLFQDCANLESVIVKKPDFAAVSTPDTATNVQKQITSIGQSAFQNAINLKGIIFADGNSTEADLVPNQVIKASPFLQSVGWYAFRNVNKIQVFDASDVINPNNKGGFITRGLFLQDADLTDANGTAITSQLQAVILPSYLDSAPDKIGTSDNYYSIDSWAFANNPNLQSVGTKQTLGWSEPQAPSTRAYVDNIKKPGFNPPKLLNVLGQESFRGTAISAIDFSQMSSYGGTGDFANTANATNGVSSFADNAKLTKVTFPTWLKKIPNSMFNNTPNLATINFSELTELTTIGTNNFNDLSNLASSTTSSSRAKRAASRATATTLDLSNTKLTTLANNTFGNLPTSITEVKLPLTIDASFATNATTLTVKSDNADAAPTKIDLKKVKFTNQNGTDGNFATFQKLMTTGTEQAPASATNGDAPQLFNTATLDLSGFSTLKTISPNTFNLAKDVLTTLQLPATATNWQIVASGDAQSVNSQYNTAAFNSANKLSEISFNGFGLNSSNQFDGSIISDLNDNNWDTNIKNNNTLWSTIATVMNSLGYDPTLQKPTDANQEWSPNIGVQGKWEVPTAGAGAQGRAADGLKIDKDLQSSDLKGTNKWWSEDKKSDVGSTDSSKGPDKDPANKPSATESMYFKHNGIIWNWTATKETDKYYITLTPDSTTLPNVYKAQSNATVENGNDPNFYITTFKTQPEASASNSKAASSYGVAIKFNIAIKKPASKTNHFNSFRGTNND